MATKDGGPAFPQTYRIDGCSTQVNAAGLTVRDYFAGQALAGIVANPMQMQAILDSLEEAGLSGMDRGAARLSYIFADAMLAERNKA